MKKCSLVITTLLFSLNMMAQTFINNIGGPIHEVGMENLFPITVSALPASCDSINFGVISVCFTIIHPYDGDLDISLRSPDGVTVKLSNNNGDSQDNFTGTCTMEDANDGEIGEASPPYLGDYFPDESINKVNDGQNPNGIWYLVVVDEAPLDSGNLGNWKLTFANDPPPTHIGGPCTTNNAIGCDCPDAAQECDLLPDMTNSGTYIQNNWTEKNKYLRLGIATPNIGYGPLEMHGTGDCFCDTMPVNCSSTCPDGSYPKENVLQTIYHKSVATMSSYQVSAGTMTYHPTHGHIHIDDWTYNTLRIRGLDPDPATWPIIGEGSKQSFCLINLGTCTYADGYCVDENGNILDKSDMPNGGLGSVSGCGTDQGIFVGRYDAYDQYLDGQTIEFGDVCNGEYYIVSITDPNNNVKETNDSDNYSLVPIELLDQLGNCCGAYFHADHTVGIAPFQVQFIDSTVPIANSWLWDFGDGSTATDQFPQHVYAAPGFYTVTLIVTTSSGCTDTLTYDEYITVDLGTGMSSLFDPKDIQLSAFPNPTDGMTAIEFELDKPSYLELNITNLVGVNMKTLFTGIHPSGKHSINLDLNKEGYPSGIYIIHAKTGNKNYFVKVAVSR